MGNMKNKFKKVAGAVVAMSAMMLTLTTAQAATIGFAPESDNGDRVSLGNHVIVNIRMFDYNPNVIQSYNLTLRYNPEVLKFTGMYVGRRLGAYGVNDTNTSLGDVGLGLVNIGVESFQAPDALIAYQKIDGIFVAKLGFDTLDVGISPIEVAGYSILDPSGQDIVLTTVKPYSVTVTPEPASLLLFGTGLTGLVWWRARRARA